MGSKAVIQKKRVCLATDSVLGEGLEPSRANAHRILSPVRLPVPPSERKKNTNIRFIFRIAK